MEREESLEANVLSSKIIKKVRFEKVDIGNVS